MCFVYILHFVSSGDPINLFLILAGPLMTQKLFMSLEDPINLFLILAGLPMTPKLSVSSEDPINLLFILADPLWTPKVHRGPPRTSHISAFPGPLRGPPNATPKKILCSILRTQNNTFCVLGWPLGGPYHRIYILCFAAAIASADPGPSTSGAYTMHPIPARPHRLVGPLQLSIRVKGKHSRPFLQGSVLKRPPLRVLRLLATTSVDP